MLAVRRRRTPDVQRDASESKGEVPDMPVKLIVLMAIMGVNAALNFILGSYVAGVFGVLILLGVAAGNEAVRKLLIGFNVLGILVGLVFGGLALAAGGAVFAPLVLVGLVFGIAAPAYGIWCLTRRDVEHWMYKRSMKGAAD